MHVLFRVLPSLALTLLIATVAVFGLEGCALPDEGCSDGLVACADTCVDPARDRLNCGACGAVCGTGQVCNDSQCECRTDVSAGSALTACGGECVTTATNARHCGACGVACAKGEVCNEGRCDSRCDGDAVAKCPGTDDTCIELATNPEHCGKCGKACGTAQSCRAGKCGYDVVAACPATGEVVGVQAATYEAGERKQLGAAPGALATLADVLMVADASAAKVVQANASTLDAVPVEASTAAAPSFVLVDDPHVYVLNAEGDSLQVFRRDTSVDAGSFPEGVALESVTTLDLGADSMPVHAVREGTSLFVALSRANSVVRVNVANPAAPTVADTYALDALDLAPFDGQTPLARPEGIAVRGGNVYVALNNTDASGTPAGPGVVARIDTQSGMVSGRVLNSADCMLASQVLDTEDGLAVSCRGSVTVSAGEDRGAGVVLLDNAEAVTSVWDAGCPTGGSGCIEPAPSAMAVVGKDLFIGDRSTGRLFVVGIASTEAGTALLEKRGLAAVEAPPVQVCPESSSGPLGIADIVATP